VRTILPQRKGFLVMLLWIALLALDLWLRTLVPNNGSPTSWSALDAGVYALGALWSLSSWYLIALALTLAFAARPRLRRLVLSLVSIFFGTTIMLSFAYRLYYFQSPSWQVVRFMVAEPENTRRILLWNLRLFHGIAFVLFSGLIGLVLAWTARSLAARPILPPRWALLSLLALYLTNSAFTLLTPGFQDPLPVEANTAAAFAQFLKVTTLQERHLVAPVRPTLPPAPPRPRPNVLLLVHESLRADAVFPELLYSEVQLNARALSPYSSTLPGRLHEGFFTFPRARSNASATESSLPSILSGLDLGGPTDAYGRVHTVWSLGKSTGARTWLFSAQTYAWSHFDEYFFDRNLDLARTGLDLAPSYANDVGVDDILPVQRALAHIRELQASHQHWVGVVHFSGTHVPGYPGPGVEPDPDEHRRWRQAARYIDQVVEQFLTEFFTSDAASTTVIVSTSDHGEPLESSRKLRRLGSHYEEVVRVPFWVRIPPGLATQHPEWTQALTAWQQRNVQNIQILPTIRDALLLEDLPEINQHLFAPSLLRPPGDAPDLVSGQSTCAFRAWWQEGLFIVNGHHKLLLSNERPSPELYDLASDPAEQHNLWEREEAREQAKAWAIPHILEGQERTLACRRAGKVCILPR
jgi:glucan phosphoethanolaminetransferase (alkaline phosphatase superfamily)